MIEVAVLRDAKAFSTRTWDGLLPTERARVLSVLGALYRAYDGLATHVMLLNGALDRIKEMTDADDPESYRCDDREGCLDTVFAVASKAREVPSVTVGGEHGT